MVWEALNEAEHKKSYKYNHFHIQNWADENEKRLKKTLKRSSTRLNYGRLAGRGESRPLPRGDENHGILSKA